MRRLQVVLGHLTGRPGSGWEPAPQAAPCWSGAQPVSADDVVVVHGRRTAIGRGGRGGFKVRPLGRAPGGRPRARAVWDLARGWLCARAVTAVSLGWDGGAGAPGTPCIAGGRPRWPRFPLQDTTPDELLSAVMTAVLRDVKLSPAQLGDICVGEHTAQALGSVLLALPSGQSPSQTPPHPPGTFQVLSLREMTRGSLHSNLIVPLGLPPPGTFRPTPTPSKFCLWSLLESSDLNDILTPKHLSQGFADTGHHRRPKARVHYPSCLCHHRTQGPSNTM